MKKVLIKIMLVMAVLIALSWVFRSTIIRFFPIHHTGKIQRIGTFSKGGYSGRNEGTRQLNQFALIFEDKFNCEATDTSFAAVREGDVVEIKAYHDVKGLPFIDPEWWECDEAQLVQLVDVKKR